MEGKEEQQRHNCSRASQSLRLWNTLSQIPTPGTLRLNHLILLMLRLCTEFEVLGTNGYEEIMFEMGGGGELKGNQLTF